VWCRFDSLLFGAVNEIVSTGEGGVLLSEQENPLPVAIFASDVTPWVAQPLAIRKLDVCEGAPADNGGVDAKKAARVAINKLRGSRAQREFAGDLKAS